MLDEVKGRRRATWILLNQNARVADASPDGVVVALATAGLRDSFAQGHSEVLAESLARVFGASVPVRLIVGAPDAGRQAPPGAQPGSDAGADPMTPRPAAPAPDLPDPATDTDLDDEPQHDASASASDLLASVLGAEPIDDLPD